jgi:fibronectin type 3 domain-containing protein
MRKFWLNSLFTILTLTLFSGCVTGVQKHVAKVDENLPVVQNLKAIEDITTIGLEWFPLKNQNIQGYHIYRNNHGGQDAIIKIATIEGKRHSHFVDKELTPGTEYTYHVSAFTKSNLESIASEPVTIKTKPMLKPADYFETISRMPRMAKLLWQPHTNPRVKSYIIERIDVSKSEWDEIAVIDDRLAAEYIDRKLKDNKLYKYRVRIKTFDNLISEPTAVKEIITKALPLQVANVQATHTAPKKIILTWSANPEKDITHYSIERSSSSNGFFKSIATVDHQADQNSFEYVDAIDEDGAIRFYRVIAHDKDELFSEPPFTPITGTTLPKPQTPTILKAKIDQKGVYIEWLPRDKRADSYIVKKFTKSGWFSKKEERFTTKDNFFHDTNLGLDVKYEYTVTEVDQFGIESVETEGIELFLPKLKKK